MNIPTHFPTPCIEMVPCFSSSLHSSHCLFIQFFYIPFSQRNRLVLKFNSSITPQCADEGKRTKSRHTEVKVPSSPACLSHPAAVYQGWTYCTQTRCPFNFFFLIGDQFSLYSNNKNNNQLLSFSMPVCALRFRRLCSKGHCVILPSTPDASESQKSSCDAIAL